MTFLLVRSLIIYLLLSVGLSAYCQLNKAVTYYDENYGNSRVNTIYYFLEIGDSSVLEGQFSQFYESGQLSIKGSYSKNQPEGIWEYYFESGQIKNRALFSKNATTYWWYYFEEGGLKKEGNLIDDLEEGNWKYYYQNQTLRKAGEYKKGLKEGEWSYFYEDSVKKGKALFEHDQGFYKEYFYDGTIKMEGQITNGLPEGVWSYYYNDGQLKAQGLELDGKKNGFWQYYYPSGTLLREGTYRKGVAEGNWKYFTKEGLLHSEGEVLSGNREGYWNYKNKNKESISVFFNDNSGVYKELYPNGNIKVRGELKGDKREGRWLFLKQDGTKYAECLYDKNVGEYKSYYKNGDIESKGMYRGNQREGIWELHDRNGQIVYLKTVYSSISSEIEDNSSYVSLDSMLIGKLDVNDNRKSNKVFKYKPVKKWRRGRRWLTEKPNEAKGVLLTFQPFAILDKRFSAEAEYFIQERQGIALSYTYYLDDNFLIRNSKGFSGYDLSLNFKAYGRNSELGMFFLGPAMKYENFQSFSEGNQSRTQAIELKTAIGRVYVHDFKQNSLVLTTGLNLGFGRTITGQQKWYPAYEVNFGLGWFFR